MNLHRHAWIVSVSAALGACAAPTPLHWEKPGATEARVKEDSEDCRVKARFAPLPASRPPAPSSSSATRVLSREQERAQHDTEYFQRCMQEKGYSARR
jgi:hypothetical protein